MKSRSELNLIRTLGVCEALSVTSDKNILNIYVKWLESLYNVIQNQSYLKVSESQLEIYANRIKNLISNNTNLSSSNYEPISENVKWHINDNLIRKRLTESNLAPKNNDFIEINTKIQDDLSEEMAYLVKNLKGNVNLTSTIIKKDNEVLTDSLSLQNKNFDKLKNVNEQIDVLNMSASPWWIWIMLIIVFAVFFWMIFFMKLFNKPK